MSEQPVNTSSRVSDRRSCVLCGTHVPTRLGPDARFCCSGCEKVYDVLGRLDDSSKSAYLETARRLGLIPDSEVERPSDRRAIGTVSAAENKEEQQSGDAIGMRRERFDVTGLVCPSCGWVAEQVLSSSEGVESVRVDYFSGSCDVMYDLTAVSADHLRELLRPLGYGLEAISDKGKRASSQKATHRFLVVAILSMNIMSLSFLRYFHSLELLDYLPSYLPWLEGFLVIPVLYLGWLPALRRALASVRYRRMTMDLLISIGVGAAAILSVVSLMSGRGDMYFETCAGLVTITLLSRMIELRLRDRAFSSLAPLMKMKVVNARRIDEFGDEIYLPVDQVRSGDQVVFETGETVPFDGIVENESAAVSEAMLTGEPVPIPKVRGDLVAAGSEVTTERLVLRVVRLFDETLLSQIAVSVGKTLAQQEHRLRKSDQIASLFIPVVLVVAVTAWVVRLIYYGPLFALTPEGWFPSIAVLAVACPCAFSLAGISAVTATIGGLMEKGFLVKELDQLDDLAAVTHVIFDKTGTLTRGAMNVEYLLWRNEPKPEMLAYVLQAEGSSVHPVAEAVRSHLAGLDIPEIEVAEPEVRDCFGQGRTALFEEGTLSVGGASLFSDRFTPDAMSPHHTAVWFGFDGRADGCFLLIDPIRSTARASVDGLKNAGITSEMVSGDRQTVATYVASEIGVSSATGDASIDDKVNIVKDRRKAERAVAYVGDGTNDALAMGEANVSISLARSTDEALAASGLVSVHGDIENLSDVFALGRKLSKVIKQNYFWAFSFNTLFIPIAAFGKLIPLAAMLLMFASSVAVLLNSLRLRGK